MQIEEIEKLLAEVTANYATATEVHAARTKLYSKCIPIIRYLIAQVKEAEKQAEIWRNDERARCLDIPKFEAEARKAAFLEAAEMTETGEMWRDKALKDIHSMQAKPVYMYIAEALRRKAEGKI